MSMGVQLLQAILPAWRKRLPPGIDEDYFEDFVERQEQALVALLDAWSTGALHRSSEQGAAAKTPPGSAAPVSAGVARDAVDPVEVWSKAQRTKRNLEAMWIVHAKAPAELAAAERTTLLGYSGWGGLSIADNREKFPPGMVPEDFGLIHEYYTPVRVAEAIARAVCPLLPSLGIGGKVRALEPSAGIGRLIRAMDRLECGAAIDWVAVEFSSISARMLGAIRPDIALHRGTFERWVQEHGPRAAGTFNLVLANPPYGERGAAAIEDRATEYRETQSYAYFMRRCMDLLAPGGLGVFLVPAGFLSGVRNRELRRRVLLRSHLAAAFRLPSEHGGKTLFPGANLVVDCIFLRSRGGSLAEVDPSDTDIVEGRYFELHKDHVLGRELGKDKGEDDQVRGGGGRYRYAVEGEFTGLPPLVERPMCEACIRRPEPPDDRRTRRPAGPVRSVDVDVDTLDAPIAAAILLGMRVDSFLAAYAAKDVERAAALWPELHDALVQFQASELVTQAGGNPWRSAPLREQADRGIVGAERLLAAFDPGTGALIETLRVRPVFEPAYTGRSDDIVAQAEWLFRSRRSLRLSDLVAFHISVGGGLPRAEIRKTLLEAKWCLDGVGWDEVVPAGVYYTGDLWPKLDRAKTYADHDAQAAEQVRRLLEVIQPVVFEDIEALTPRERWVPLPIVEDWFAEAVNQGLGRVALHDRGGVLLPASVQRYEDLEQAPVLSSEALWVLGWINHDRSNFSPLAAKTDRSEHVDTVRIRLGKTWQESFREFCAKDPARREAIATAYNRRFRGFAPPTYSEEPLFIARWGTNAPRLHPWQIAAARRVLDNRGGGVALGTGLGKTLTALAILGVARQEGWAKRPVIVVPTSIVWQWREVIAQALPDYRVGVVGSKRKKLSRGPRVQRAARLLADGKIAKRDYERMITTSEPDTPSERAATWTMLQAGLLDVVLLTYDAMPRTQVNLDALIQYVDRKAAVQRMLTLRRRNALKRPARGAEDDTERDDESDVLDVETQALTERQEAELKHSTAAWVAERLELPEGWEYDPGIAWDDIGIDLLIVDEAASFKNLYMPEPREFGVPRFMGSAGEGSDRAWQLDFRAALVRQRTGGSGVVLLSATPAKNSPLEFYNLIQYIDDEAFARVGITDPEQFIDRYLLIEPRQLLDASLQATTEAAVVGFRNLDELRAIVFRYFEFKTAEEVRLKLPEPSVDRIPVEMDAAQEAKYEPMVADIQASIRMGDVADVLGKLARLALIATHADLDEGYTWETALEGGEVVRKIPLTSLKPWVSRGWSVVGEPGKKWVKIQRVLPRPRYESPKFAAVAERIVVNPRCGHIVFCENLAAQRWLVEVLVARGIPRERIAVLNGKATKNAQDRHAIAQGFNGDPDTDTPPIYDVVVCNQVAQEGINLQTRTCAIYHVDLPWTPSDLEQRNGRGFRQGNTLSEMSIYYILSLRSMDGFRYNQIQGKATWLSVLIKSGVREMNNPGAQANLSPEETLLMISRDKAGTERLLAEIKAKKEEEARALEAKNAARLLARAGARFRDARAEKDAVQAARLRAEGEALLAEVQRVRPEAWPWAPWIGRIREVEYLIPADGAAPVYEGLRAGREGQVYRDRLEFFEFGRVAQDDKGAVIGLRGWGSETWNVQTLAEVEALALTPEALQRGTPSWPEGEERSLEDKVMTHVARLARAGMLTWASLGWRGASDAWMEIWWPRVQRPFVEGVLRAYRNAETYPVVIGGVLHLVARDRLAEGELLAPTVSLRKVVAL